MQNHWLVQIRLHILAILLLRTTTSFIKDQPIFLLDTGLIGQQNKSCGEIRPLCGAQEPPTAEAS